jgi:hypothetical protein
MDGFSCSHSWNGAYYEQGQTVLEMNETFFQDDWLMLTAE